MQQTVPLDIHPFSDRGRREHQEDYFYTGPAQRDGAPWLGAVADGMGGHRGGDVASKAGVHALKQAFDEAVSARQRTDTALTTAVTAGHEAVLAAAERMGSLGNMGSTVVAFAIDGNTLYWCSAGDSRLYLCRGATLLQLSRDFTLAEDMRRGAGAGGAWSKEDIQNSPQRNALTSFMGTDHWRFHADSRPLQEGDVLVACSDGVYGTAGAEGIAAACQAGGSALRIAEALQKQVVDAARPNQDNSTAVVVRYGQGGNGGGLALASPPSVGAAGAGAAAAVAAAAQGKPWLLWGGAAALLSAVVALGIAMALGWAPWRGPAKPVQRTADGTSSASAPAPASTGVPPVAATRRVTPKDSQGTRLGVIEELFRKDQIAPEVALENAKSLREDAREGRASVDADFEQRIRVLQTRAWVKVAGKALSDAKAASKTPAKAIDILDERLLSKRAEVPVDGTHGEESRRLLKEAEDLRAQLAKKSAPVTVASGSKKNPPDNPKRSDEPRVASKPAPIAAEPMPGPDPQATGKPPDKPAPVAEPTIVNQSF